MSEAALAPRHDAEAYSSALRDLLPSGPAWPDDCDANLSKLIDGIANVFDINVDRIAALFLDTETDPRKTRQLLVEWETAFGLPDDCVDEPTTIDERIDALLLRMTMQGGQSRSFFIRIASLIGYEIDIVEFSPFMIGISRVGDTRIGDDDYAWRVGPPEMRFYWQVRVLNSKVVWFRTGSGQVGIDHHVEFSFASDLECLLRRYKPAHTQIVFDYSGLRENDPLAGI